MNRQNLRTLPKVISLFGLGLAIFLAVYGTLPSKVLPENTLASDFSASQAMRHIEAIAAESRPAGTKGNFRAREYILEQLDQMGLESAIQSATVCRHFPKSRCANPDNILAKIDGTDSADAIELSSGMWECLLRPEEELGFRPVLAPEPHTRIRKPAQQSYFLPYAEELDLTIPIILVGGNRDIERLETILQNGKVDFIALCRPLIREPDLPNRWRAGIGRSLPECVSCNSCIHAVFVHPGKPEPSLVTCICKTNKKQHQQAQKWLVTWREN